MTAKRSNEEMSSHPMSMELDDPRTSQDLLDTISAKLKSVKESDKAEACAILSSLDPNSRTIHQKFLVKDFCQSLLFPCLLSSKISTVLEAANTLKCWLFASAEDESLFAIKRLYALGLLPVLLEAVPVLCKSMEGYVNISSPADRQILEETVESVLAAIMLIGESLAVAWEQINKSALIDLIIVVLDRRQFCKEGVLVMAMECLAVATEDNPGFYEGPKGLRLCMMLAGLPADWTSSKAAPLAIRSLVVMAETHTTPQDMIVEKAVSSLGKLVQATVEPEVLGTAFETLARIFEDVNPEGLESDDQRQVFELLELCSQKLTVIISTSQNNNNSMEDVLMGCVSRGIGAIINLLVLLAGSIGDNVIGMLAKEALAVWLPACLDDTEATEVLLSLIRLLCTSASSSQLPCSQEEYGLLLRAANSHVSGVPVCVALYRPEFNESKGLLIDKLRGLLCQNLNDATKEDLFDALEAATGHHFDDDLELCINSFISALEN